MPGYSNMAPKMESNKQERSNLLHDNPVAKDASGGRPWISKHFKSSMGSAMRMDHDGSPVSKHDGKTFDDPGFMDTHFKSGKPRNSAATMKEEEAPMPKKDKKRKAAVEKKYNAAAEKHCMGKKH
jgi:hypothetical protein